MAWDSDYRCIIGEDNVDRLLLAIGEYMGWKGDISHVYVTSLSSISDFGLEPDDITKLSEKLGLAISESDYLTDIAQKMK
jgi:hypothetical protein